MLANILFVLWFFLPAGVANMTPIFAARFPGLRRWHAPLDGGRSFRGMRIFGANKTWRGLICGMIAATLVLALQQWMAVHMTAVQSLTAGYDYPALPTLVLGPLLGFGALAGDAIESFFKRQHHVAPGDSWFPFDQIDYILGGCLASLPIIQLTLVQYGLLLLVWFGMHVLVSFIGYLLGLKAKPI